MPKISVVVPIYKVEDYLAQCIASILAQTLQDMEVILVDEGDDDACYAIMKMFERMDSRVKIIHQKCGGYGFACNLGIRAATGDYLSIIESDDFIEPTMFEDLYNRAKELDVDVIKSPFYCYYDYKDGKEEYRVLCDYAERVTQMSPPGAFSILDHPEQMSVHASIWSGLYRTAFMQKNAIYFIEQRPGAYVDVEFRIRAFVEAEKIAWWNEPYYNWRLTNMTSSTNTFNLKTMLVRWKEAHDYFDKMHPSVYRKVGPQLILDEYLNTFAIFFVRPEAVTEEHFQAAKENLSRIDPAIYRRSRALRPFQVGQMLNFERASSLADLKLPLPLFERMRLKSRDVLRAEIERVGRSLRVALAPRLPGGIFRFVIQLPLRASFSCSIGRE